MMFRKVQSGRSMLEMLAVIAIVGILSVVTFFGYEMAMTRYRANQVIKETNMLALHVNQQLENDVEDEEIDLTEWGAEEVGDFNIEIGGYDGTFVISTTSTAFEVRLSDVDKAVCERIVNAGWPEPYAIFVGSTPVPNAVCGDNNQIRVAYNNTLDDDTPTCNPGYGWNEAQQACEACGYSQHSVGNECVNCPSGSRGSTDRTECVCYDGSIWNAAGTACEYCPAGTWQRGAECADCPAGVTSYSGSTTCRCPSNHRFNVNTNTCDACPEGATAYSGSKVCLCPAGYKMNAGETACEICPVGTWASSGSIACTPCPVGSTAAPEGSTSPSACTCPIGTFLMYSSSESGYVCEPCPEGSDPAPSGSTSVSACKCPEGTFSKSVNGHYICAACPEGTTPAPKGSTSVSACKCPADTYMKSTNNEYVCEACPANSVSDEGATYIYDCKCPADTYMTYANNVYACQACPEGTTSDMGTTSAYYCKCPADTYQISTNGVYSCQACPEGMTSSVGATSVSYCKCPADTYRISTDGVYSCQPCPEGATSSVGSTSLNSCTCATNAIKVNWGQSNAACQLCPSGTYRNGTTQCTSCPINATSEPGSTSSSACVCPDGYTKNNTSGACEPCSGSFGKYYDAETGQCLDCTPEVALEKCIGVKCHSNPVVAECGGVNSGLFCANGSSGSSTVTYGYCAPLGGHTTPTYSAARDQTLVTKQVASEPLGSYEAAMGILGDHYVLSADTMRMGSSLSWCASQGWRAVTFNDLGTTYKTDGYATNCPIAHALGCVYGSWMYINYHNNTSTSFASWWGYIAENGRMGYANARDVYGRALCYK